MQAQIEALAIEIMEAQRKRRHSKHPPSDGPRSTTASSLGYRCERRLVYARTRPEMARPIGEELASIFEEGDMHELDVKKELIDLGYEPLEGQRSFYDKGLEIGGKIDCMLAISPEHRAERVTVEIKSCTGPPPRTAEGLRNNEGILGRYYAQMQSYLFLTGKPWGMFLFKDKITGLWYLVPVPLDYGYAEVLLQKAERVKAHMAAGTLPDRIADRSECSGCPFNDSICLPAEAPIDPLLLVNDDELLAQIEELERIEGMAKRHKKLDAIVKERFKLTKGERFVVGDEKGFLVSKKKHGKGVRIDISRLSTG